MGLNLFTSLLLGWVCISLSIGGILWIASLSRDGRNDFGSYD